MADLQLPPEGEVARLSYARDTELRRSALFSGWYVAAGVLVLIFGVVSLLAHGFALAVVLGGTASLLEMLQLYALLAAGIPVDVLMIVGSAYSFSRAPRARRWIVLAAKLDLAIIGIGVLIQVCTLLYARWLGLRVPLSGPIALVVGSGIRAAIDLVILAAYRNMRADFFFMEHEAEPPLIVPEKSTPAQGATPRATGSATFRISGIDTATGRDVQYESRAADETLARKSAIAMGLDPASLKVQPL